MTAHPERLTVAEAVDDLNGLIEAGDGYPLEREDVVSLAKIRDLLLARVEAAPVEPEEPTDAEVEMAHSLAEELGLLDASLSDLSAYLPEHEIFAGDTANCEGADLTGLAKAIVGGRGALCRATKLLARVEAAPVEPEREALEAALLNVSVHSAHLPDAPRELLVQLLAKCGQIARAALAGDPTGEPKENET